MNGRVSPAPARRVSSSANTLLATPSGSENVVPVPTSRVSKSWMRPWIIDVTALMMSGIRSRSPPSAPSSAGLTSVCTPLSLDTSAELASEPKPINPTLTSPRPAIDETIADTAAISQSSTSPFDPSALKSSVPSIEPSPEQSWVGDVVDPDWSTANSTTVPPALPLPRTPRTVSGPEGNIGANGDVISNVRFLASASAGVLATAPAANMTTAATANAQRFRFPRLIPAPFATCRAPPRHFSASHSSKLRGSPSMRWFC